MFSSSWVRLWGTCRRGVGLGCLGAAAIAAGPALAAPSDAGLPMVAQAALVQLPPGERAAQIKRQVLAQQRAGAGSRAGQALDTTAPRITAFKVERRGDPTMADNQVLLQFTAEDDLSGLDRVEAIFVGPHGQEVVATSTFGVGQTRLPVRAALHMNRYTEPGVWKIQSVHGWDVAGNLFYQDRDSLMALGNTDFTLANSQYDVTAPQLLRGQLSASTLSLSQPWPGTVNLHPYLSARITLTDAGDVGISGANVVNLVLCTDDRSSCISLGSDSPGSAEFDRAKTQLLAGAWLHPLSGVKPGVYHVYSVSMYDNAVNARWLYSTRFGGAVDFSAYFPFTTVTLTP